MSQRPTRGRPPKFGRPARTVSMTLPDDVLAWLAERDPDIARAIVQVVDRLRARGEPDETLGLLSRFGNRAVLVVPPISPLRRLSGVELVPLASGRALISLNAPLSAAQFELEVRDALEDERIPARERKTLLAVADTLKTARLSPDVRLRERTILVLESGARARPRAAVPVSSVATPPAPRLRDA
jgi:hypothetical protein